MSETHNIPLAGQECCDDKKYPFTKKRGKYRFGMFTDIPNPIPSEITDPEQIELTFRNYPFIPYAGTDHKSNHSLLNWLNSMSHLSATHGSCINSIKSYALGQPLDIIKSMSDSFGLNSKLTDSQKESFVNFLDDTLQLEYGSTIHKLALNSYKNTADNGNIFMLLKMSKKIGIAANLTLYNTENVCYLKPKAGANRKVGISHEWGHDYIQKHPPKIVPVYPAMRVSQDGLEIETMIHIKEDTTKLYGRPIWINAFMSVYREFQNGNYLIKQAANNFMGQVLIEVEDAEGSSGSVFDDEDAQKDGFKNAADRFKENFTAQSDNPQTAILLSRPFGAKPVFVEQFKPNTNEKFYKTMSELIELDIIRAHQWSKRFLGENQTQGFSKDVFLDELKVKEAGVLPHIRNQACAAINIAIKLMVAFFDKPEFKNYKITGQNNIDILKELMPSEDLSEGLTTTNKKSDAPINSTGNN